MIKLYDKNETDFRHNGLGILSEALSCNITEEDNGMFELELTYLYNGFLSEFLVNDNIIKAKPNYYEEEQLFRIYRVINDINEEIKVYARHITYDLQDNFIEEINVLGVNCKQAGCELFKKAHIPHNFTFYSDITHLSDFKMERSNILESIAGKRGSLLDTYGNGAKLIRNNFSISLMKKRGENNNVLISYKKNLIGYTRTIDQEELVTAIYPYAKYLSDDGETEVIVSLPEKFIYSKNYNNQKKILAVDFSSSNITTEEELRRVSSTYFQRTKKDVPKINYKIEFIELSKTLEYKDLGIENLEKISLCDIVNIRDYRIGMNIEAEVIKIVFDAINEEYLQIELGNFKDNLFNTISSLNTYTQIQIQEVGSNLEQKIDKIKEIQGQTITNGDELKKYIDRIKEDFQRQIRCLQDELKNKVNKNIVKDVVYFSSSEE